VIKVINLYSDTQTRPVQRMREAMAAAEVGDEQRGEDPTVTALCERVAGLLGKPAAVFLPSGTMCNAIGFRLHIRPGGDAVHLHPTSHPIVAEGGGPSALSGAVLAPVAGEGGMFTAGTLEAALFPAGDRYKPRSRLVSVEQTTNLAGGRVWPLEQMRAVLEVAARHGLRTHLDGARLMNAVVASGVAAADWARGFDTAWIDFTKGLGAPVGAVLVGSTESIGQAWRYKQMMGGSLRQAGIVAAGCLWALDHHVDRLAEDHANARILAEGRAPRDGRGRRGTCRQLTGSSAPLASQAAVVSNSSTGRLVTSSAAPFMAACDLSGSGSLNSSAKAVGTICQETPYRSFNQPHGPSWPPSDRALQKWSTSSCVWQLT
jgi:threonine aldolase